MEPTENYNKNTIYVYEGGGSTGRLNPLMNTEYKEVNKLFRYIPCMKMAYIIPWISWDFISIGMQM